MVFWFVCLLDSLSCTFFKLILSQKEKRPTNPMWKFRNKKILKRVVFLLDFFCVTTLRKGRILKLAKPNEKFVIFFFFLISIIRFSCKWSWYAEEDAINQFYGSINAKSPRCAWPHAYSLHVPTTIGSYDVLNSVCRVFMWENPVFCELFRMQRTPLLLLSKFPLIFTNFTCELNSNWDRFFNRFSRGLNRMVISTFNNFWLISGQKIFVF